MSHLLVLRKSSNTRSQKPNIYVTSQKITRMIVLSKYIFMITTKNSLIQYTLFLKEFFKIEFSMSLKISIFNW